TAGRRMTDSRGPGSTTAPQSVSPPDPSPPRVLPSRRVPRQHQRGLGGNLPPLKLRRRDYELALEPALAAAVVTGDDPQRDRPRGGGWSAVLGFDVHGADGDGAGHQLAGRLRRRKRAGGREEAIAHGLLFHL